MLNIFLFLLLATQNTVQIDKSQIIGVSNTTNILFLLMADKGKCDKPGERTIYAIQKSTSTGVAGCWGVKGDDFYVNWLDGTGDQTIPEAEIEIINKPKTFI